MTSWNKGMTGVCLQKQKSFILNHINPRPYNFYERFNYRNRSNAYELRLNQALQEAPQSEKLLNLKRGWEMCEYNNDWVCYEDEKNIRKTDKETQGTRCINETLDERLNIKKPSDKLVSSSKDHGGASKKTTNRQFKNQIGNIDNKENEEDGSETEEVNEAKRLATEEPTRMNIILRIRQEDGASIKKKEPSTNITKYNIEESIPVEECEEMDYVKTIK
ncbi:8125_t:CDS:2 [Racocetra fulgida]|uniref:8125_t:CDS:1 n=1 Tax=Racocetra fulgida TaxID=60492 RepID=A0A9N8Z6I1_9GLOM|nr:8125_t:CDS:2 [Racocetra fulgida]